MLHSFKFKFQIDTLVNRHQALVRDAQLLQVQNPPAAKIKLLKAKRVQEQIEELKLAYLN